ncbi:MAG: acetate kinase [candidate division Zixibacteria bacterium]|nr:acetate kinase [candidate division Zixibacteria bacterium]MBU1469211.1 acetate kinase [candidate division Zixibacteria bacterium]MBU2626551.1 acetate kinase [candidate division Zixibacteria bacterium]
MKVLVINAGSSSVKYQMIDTETEICLAKGDVSRIGMAGAVLTHKPHDRDAVKISGEILDHIMAIEHVISMLLSPNHGVIKDKSEIDAVGHRVVHGGERFTESTLIGTEVLAELRDMIDLAPLHNPHNIRGITACMKILEHAPQVAVFDTALHHQMPDYAYMYGIPYVLYTKYQIRRYGFHGMSHRYVSVRAAKLMDRKYEDLKIITIHLGNGASIAAIDGGISIDTSMGLTPLEGLMMGTRSGDMDPAIILRIMSTEELSLHEANTLLNKHSGLMGVSGRSSDMREIISAMDEDRKRARLAFEMYCYRIKKYIGAYIAAMNGADAIVFTAGVGENSPRVRSAVLADMDWFGIKIDEEKNADALATESDISAEDSAVNIYVIPTNEELVIAKDTDRVVREQADKNPT